MKKRLKFEKGGRTFYVSLCKGSIFTNILIYESQKILGIPFSHLVSVETTAELRMYAQNQNIYFDSFLKNKNFFYFLNSSIIEL